MSAWSFTLAPGGDITGLVDIPSIVRDRKLFTELVPNTNRLDFRAKFDAAIFAALMSNDVIEVTVTKDAAAYFTGVLSPNYKASVRDGHRYMNLIAEDYNLSRLGQTIAAPFACAGFAVCTPAATATSLVHAIAAAAGVTLAASPPTIASVVPYVVALPDDNTTWGKLLADILFGYGYVYIFQADGTMAIIPSINTGAITTTATLTTAAGSANIRGELEIEKSPEKYDDIRVKYDLVELKTGIVLFQDTTGGTETSSALIPLAAAGDAGGKDYYPLTSKVGEVYSAWKNPDGFEIWVATSAALDVTVAAGIIADRALTNYYRKCSFSYKNPTGGILNITKLRITGNAYVVTSKNTARSSIASAKKLYEYEAKYIFNDAAAATLAKAIGQYYAYSDIKYTARSKEVLDIGEYVLVSDAIYSGLSTACRVIGAIDRENARGVIEYALEGVADFTAITVATDGVSVPNTVTPPGSVPAPDNNVTNVVFDEAQNANGTNRVTATWDYVQGTNPADAAFIYWNSAISSAPAAFDYSRDTAAAQHMTIDGTYSWSADFPGRTGGAGGAPYRYQFGVVAARGSLLHTSGAVTPAGWDDITLVPIIQDMPIRSSDGQGVNRRAIQINDSSLDWLDAPDTSPASDELLVARIGRLGVGGAVLLDGDFEANITRPWSERTTIVSSANGGPGAIFHNSAIRFGYLNASYQLCERIITNGAVGSESIIDSTAVYSSSEIRYFYDKDGLLNVISRNAGGLHKLEHRVYDGSSWGSPVDDGLTGFVYLEVVRNGVETVYVMAGSSGAATGVYLYRKLDGGLWSSIEYAVSSIAVYSPCVASHDGLLRISYCLTSSNDLYEVAETSPGVFGSPSLIQAGNIVTPKYITDLSGRLSLTYSDAADSYKIYSKTLIGTTYGTGSVYFDSETAISQDVFNDAYFGGNILSYSDGSAWYYRTLQRYARIGAGIIESGSNANGSYVKWGNGTMMQWGLHAPATNNNAGTTYNYPSADFVSVQSLLSSANAIVSGGFGGSYVTENRSAGLSAFVLKVLLHTATTIEDAPNIGISWQAIGRWK